MTGMGTNERQPIETRYAINFRRFQPYVLQNQLFTDIGDRFTTLTCYN